MITNQELRIISPTDIEVWFGETKTLEYKIANDNEYPVKKLEVAVQTVKPDNSRTKDNFAKVISKPDIIMGKKEGICKVELSIPELADYTEFIMKDGKEIPAPISVAIVAKGVEYVQEL